jgi:hypothetical protein
MGNSDALDLDIPSAAELRATAEKARAERELDAEQARSRQAAQKAPRIADETGRAAQILRRRIGQAVKDAAARGETQAFTYTSDWCSEPTYFAERERYVRDLDGYLEESVKAAWEIVEAEFAARQMQASMRLYPNPPFPDETMIYAFIVRW